MHQNFTKDVGLYGVPVVLIGELVLRQARSLEDAEAILGKHRPASLWTFVVTDLKSGETMAVESSPKQFHVRRGEENLFVQTNHAMNEKTRESENASLGMRANSIFRMKRAFEMLERNAPSAALLARVLSYQDNAEGQLSAYHDILKAETLQSVIFESAIGKSATLYLSVDEAPAASGRYAAFPLAALWNRETPQMKIVDFLRTSVERRLEQRHTAEAFRLYFDEREPYAAYEKLRYQRTLNAALFRAVALYQSDRFAESLQEAAAALRDNTFLTEPVYIRDSLEWVWLANLLRLGRRDDARNLAQKILEKDDGKSLPPRLSGIARGVLQNRYISVWDLNLAFDFFSGDLSGRDH